MLNAHNQHNMKCGYFYRIINYREKNAWNHGKARTSKMCNCNLIRNDVPEKQLKSIKTLWIKLYIYFYETLMDFTWSILLSNEPHVSTSHYHQRQMLFKLSIQPLIPAKVNEHKWTTIQGNVSVWLLIELCSWFRCEADKKEVNVFSTYN